MAEEREDLVAEAEQLARLGQALLSRTHPDDRDRIRALIRSAIDHPAEVPAHHAVREWHSSDDGVVGLLRRLGAALDFPVGAVWIPDDADERLLPRALWYAPGIEVEPFLDASRAASFARGEGIPGRVWETQAPLIVEEAAEVMLPERRGAAEALGLRSAAAFAATREDAVVAVLSFYAFDRRGTSERLLRTLGELGRELGALLGLRHAARDPRPLTDRELEVLQLAADGLSGPAIAERLVVSPTTVKTHFDHIYEKLGVGDRAAAVAQALRAGLIR